MMKMCKQGIILSELYILFINKFIGVLFSADCQKCCKMGLEFFFCCLLGFFSPEERVLTLLMQNPERR